MGTGPYRYGQQARVPQPPSPFFDGTRLGLEGTMLATLVVAIPGGMHIGLSAILGYAARYAEGVPAQAKPFSLMGFLFASILGIVGLSMMLFFGGSIPTMAYSVGLVSFMLRWVGKRWGRERLVASIIGGVCGLIVGVLGSAIVLLMLNPWPTPPGQSLPFGLANYVTLFRWPEILTVDGIGLLWATVYPFANIAAGAQIGWRLGKQLEDLSAYYFW